jgi:LemA protein
MQPLQTPGSLTQTMPKPSKNIVIIGIIIIVVLWLISSYNGLISSRQPVDTAWAAVQTDYQRRADLIGQLISTVKGVANYEKSTLEAVVGARSKATSITVDAGNPESMKAYMEAQGQLQGSLSRLLAVTENYPQLRATDAFAGLQSQIEGTENRIAVARKDYNSAVGAYNVKIMRFPTNIMAKMFGFTPRTQFAADAGTEKAPTIEFGDFGVSGADSNNQ